ncbi:siphovirus Gp157 family protein [bacterium]|nr:siphovirus Gp157 family protein [bacterium]
MQLYEINATYQELLNLDLEPEDLELALKGIKTSLVDKVTNIGYIMQNMNSDVIALKAEQVRLKAKETAIKNRSESLKQYVSDTMLEMDEKKIETPLFTFSFRKSQTVEFDDKDLIPTIYKESIVTEKIDKNNLKKILKTGELIVGCHLQDHSKLQVK